MPNTSDAVDILKHLSGVDPETDAEMQQIAEDCQVAQLIYGARTGAGLTQAQLAKMIGTTQSVVSQLENAEYQGHSLSMLRRIATALKSRVEIRFVPLEK